MIPIAIHCFKEKGIRYICEPEPRQDGSLMPKWWCFKCNRYVLPDKFHRFIAGKKAFKQLTSMCVKP